jgi:hypothetical protein
MALVEIEKKSDRDGRTCKGCVLAYTCHQRVLVGRKALPSPACPVHYGNAEEVALRSFADYCFKHSWDESITCEVANYLRDKETH